jgi:hypothetical protein
VSANIEFIREAYSEDSASRASLRQMAFFAANSRALYEDVESVRFAPIELAASQSW